MAGVVFDSTYLIDLFNPKLTGDRRAATECALLLAEAWDSKTQKAVTRTKFKFDWMIVACAASRDVQRIYTDDADIQRCASLRGVQTVRQTDLRVPPGSRQMRIPEAD